MRTVLLSAIRSESQVVVVVLVVEEVRSLVGAELGRLILERESMLFDFRREREERRNEDWRERETERPYNTLSLYSIARVSARSNPKDLDK
ncbi:hypothetical protein LguiA_029588 [Lonicera macranthoides]